MSEGDMSRVLNPVEVEAAIRQAAQTVYEGVDIVTVRLQEYKDADRQYDLDYAHAFMNHSGPQGEKRYQAEIDTTEARKARDVAEVAWKYAERRIKAAESTLSAFQTISKSVTQMYGASGRVEH